MASTTRYILSDASRLFAIGYNHFFARGGLGPRPLPFVLAAFFLAVFRLAAFFRDVFFFTAMDYPFFPPLLL
jgi:hypothetical protein